MRILFSTTAGMGHFHPLVPLAQAAVRVGHEVAFACPQVLCPYVEASGFPAFATFDEDSIAAGRAALGQRLAQPPAGETSNNVMVADGFIGLYARQALPELVALCQRWQPDVIVHEACEFGGAIAAERYGLPHAIVQIIYDYNFGTSQEFSPRMSQRLDELRAEWGLPADPEMAMPYRYLYFSFDPPSLLDPATPMPPTMQQLRVEVFDRSSAEALPNWLAKDYARPLIYVTLGSEAAKFPGVFPSVYQTLLAGLRDVDGTVVLTIGRNHDPAELGPQPDHIHVERYIPQSLLLPHCDVVVTHGGHNTVLAALQYGLPMVLVPLFADQFDNAARCAMLEVGRVIETHDLSPDNVRNAVWAVLNDDRYRHNAHQLRAEIQALPGVEHGIHMLEQLVAEHSTISI